MSRIGDLLAELCPDGVPFKTLGDCVSKNVGGGTPSKSVNEYWNGDIPWASVGDLSMEHSRVSSTRLAITDVAVRASSTNVIKAGDVIVAVKISPGRMKVAGIDVAINQDMRGLTLHKWMDADFLTYFFQTVNVIGNGTIVKGITNAALMAVKVPVPPLSVQREIVSALDRFRALETELEEELETELEARRSQYEHHRDELLGFEGREDVRSMTLGEVANEFGRGKSKHRPRNDPTLYGGEIPFIQTGDIRNAGHVINDFKQRYSEAGLAQSKLWPAGTLCITIAANIAETAILGFDSCFPDSVIGFVADPAKADVRFVQHLLIHSRTSLQAKGRGSAQSNINLATFENTPLPFPPVNEQARIACALDKLDALVVELSRELTVEIEARQAQYEYYRDRLLTFEELVA